LHACFIYIFTAIWLYHFGRSYCSYILNKVYPKLCMELTNYQMKIFFSLQHFNEIIFEGVIVLFLALNISSKSLYQNFSYIFMEISENFACLFITICRLTYHYSSLIRPFWKEFFAFLKIALYFKWDCKASFSNVENVRGGGFQDICFWVKKKLKFFLLLC
jgi:hypothetical protein